MKGCPLTPFPYGIVADRGFLTHSRSGWLSCSLSARLAAHKFWYLAPKLLVSRVKRKFMRKSLGYLRASLPHPPWMRVLGAPPTLKSDFPRGFQVSGMTERTG
jgi:hypothetical protein